MVTPHDPPSRLLRGHACPFAAQQFDRPSGLGVGRGRGGDAPSRPRGRDFAEIAYGPGEQTQRPPGAGRELEAAGFAHAQPVPVADDGRDGAGAEGQIDRPDALADGLGIDEDGPREQPRPLAPAERARIGPAPAPDPHHPTARARFERSPRQVRQHRHRREPQPATRVLAAHEPEPLVDRPAGEPPHRCIGCISCIVCPGRARRCARSQRSIDLAPAGRGDRRRLEEPGRSALDLLDGLQQVGDVPPSPRLRPSISRCPGLPPPDRVLGEGFGWGLKLGFGEPIFPGKDPRKPRKARPPSLGGGAPPDPPTTLMCHARSHGVRISTGWVLSRLLFGLCKVFR